MPPISIYQEVNMFITENLQILSHISLIGFFLVFFVGITMAFNPRSISLIPVIIGYVAGNGRNGSVSKSFKMVSAFVVGMTVADVLLGILFAYIGRKVEMIFGPQWEIVLGILLIILGLRWLRVFKFRTIGLHLKGKETNSLIGAFLLGIPSSMSFCPFCIPYLLTILTIAASTGQVWYSAALMLFFSLGRGLPLLIAGVSIGAIKHTHFLHGYIPIFEKAGGTVLVFMGIYYIYSFSQYLTVF
jgi:cytochrome c-type biogenesis protein